MKIKVSEAKDQVLDYLVAKCEGRGFVFGETDYTDGRTYQRGTAQATGPHYSTNWAQGGPIIEREKISIMEECNGTWMGSIGGCTDLDMPLWQEHATTPLIAAMRCYVASKLGDDVEVPEELVCQ
jgi:hypothetical protein